MLATEQADKERNWLLLYSNISNTRILHKNSHPVLVNGERADKERNRSLLVKHTHIHKTRTFSNKNSLAVVGNGVSRHARREIG